MIQLKEKLKKIKWDVVGLSEVRRRRENQVTLGSGNLFHYKGLEKKSEGGVGFMVHKRLRANIKEVKKLAWAVYGNLKYVFKAELSNCLKRKVFNQCVLTSPVFTYGAETLTLTKRTIKKILVTQLAMERSMLAISGLELDADSTRQRTVEIIEGSFRPAVDCNKLIDDDDDVDMLVMALSKPPPR
ncbi:uncharacterized protein LOC125503566 [Dendroctonus ponderosae]|uniref:uncharacterized protein LOC125503566 n=1 Tax=Dendroctonus ponderosae TaxID=77166 RepID=UPI002034B78A|nr:uncharacterized protein LOC125503566 [Dendroctonus ponderosae]